MHARQARFSTHYHSLSRLQGLQTAIAFTTGTLCALSAWLQPLTLPVAIAAGAVCWALVGRLRARERSAPDPADSALARRLSAALGRPGHALTPAPALAEQALHEYTLLRAAACAAVLAAGQQASPHASTAELARSLRDLGATPGAAAARAAEAESLAAERRARAAEARALEELAVARGQVRMLTAQRDAACGELAALQVEAERQLDEYDGMVEALEDRVSELEREKRAIAAFLLETGQLASEQEA